MELSEIDLFSNFSSDELNKFAEAVETLDLQPGDILFNEGDPGDALYIIQDGAVRIFKNIDIATGEEKSLALLEPGTYLGEMTLIDGTPRSAGARAESPATILRITRERFLQLLTSYPQAAIRLFMSFMRVMSQRLRQTNEELVVMYEVGRSIGAAPPLPQLIRSLLENTMRGTTACFSVFFKANDITGKLEAMDAIGPGFEEILDLQMELHQGAVGLAIKQNELLKVDDLETDERLADVARFGYERNCMLIAPLSRNEVSFGAILVGEPSEAPVFDAAHVNLMHGVASQAAAAVEAALLHAESDAKEKMDRHFFRF